MMQWPLTWPQYRKHDFGYVIHVFAFSLLVGEYPSAMIYPTMYQCMNRSNVLFDMMRDFINRLFVEHVLSGELN